MRHILYGNGIGEDRFYVLYETVLYLGVDRLLLRRRCIYAFICLKLYLYEEELDFINRLRRPVIWGGGYRLYRFAGGQEGFDRRFGND